MMFWHFTRDSALSTQDLESAESLSGASTKFNCFIRPVESTFDVQCEARGDARVVVIAFDEEARAFR